MTSAEDLPFAEPELLEIAVALLGSADRSTPHPGDVADTVEAIHQKGSGSLGALTELAPLVVGQAAQLQHPGYFAHMDPPTPSIAQAGALWAAALNQNLLHDDTGPVARRIEAAVINWLAPFFGMDGGHMVPGSSLANLTALWTAREVRGVTRVVASETAHLSIRKAASILGLEFIACAVERQRLVQLPGIVGDLSDAALVLTAGTTSTGCIDDLSLGDPAWLHVDAAWAGPLRLSPSHAHLLHGIERADSVAVSAHKWLYQPKESACVLFRDVEQAHGAISFGGVYLASANVGLQGSHGFMALPLYLTAQAWGTAGFAARIDADMERAESFIGLLEAENHFESWGPNQTGVIAWRPSDVSADQLRSELVASFVSATSIGRERWLRSVVANPFVNAELVLDQARQARKRVLARG